MIARAFLVILSICSSSVAFAEDCRQLPAGPARFSCVSRNHPQAAAKMQRCKRQGQQMGLAPGKAGGLQGYVQSCMQRGQQ